MPLEILNASLTLKPCPSTLATRITDHPLRLLVFKVLLLLLGQIIVLVVLIDSFVIKVRIIASDEPQSHLPLPLLLAVFLAGGNIITVLGEDLPIGAARVAEHRIRIRVRKRIHFGLRPQQIRLQNPREPFGAALRLPLLRCLESTDQAIVQQWV